MVMTPLTRRETRERPSERARLIVVV